MLEEANKCPFEMANDYVYSREDFKAVADLIYADSGIKLEQGKAMLVYSRLSKRLRLKNLQRFSDYIELIKRDKEERRQMINLLTTNHTYFFREPHHFDHFVEHVRPELVSKALREKPVRFWSAGCSSGEEVYSLAISFLGADPRESHRLLGSNSRFLATDLADHAIEQGMAGEYPMQRIEPVPTNLSRHWISGSNDNAEISQPVKSLVKFRRLNLMRAWPFNILFDVIFCRNVMIYFDEPTKAKLLERFAAQLEVGGYLYIGHSERLLGTAKSSFEPVGNTIFRKVR